MVSTRHRSNRLVASNHRAATTVPPVTAGKAGKAGSSMANNELHRTQINAANNAELRANAQSILAEIQTHRLKNTTRTYTPKQREFQVCDVPGPFLPLPLPLPPNQALLILTAWPGIL